MLPGSRLPSAVTTIFVLGLLGLLIYLAYRLSIVIGPDLSEILHDWKFYLTLIASLLIGVFLVTRPPGD